MKVTKRGMQYLLLKEVKNTIKNRNLITEQALIKHISLLIEKGELKYKTLMGITRHSSAVGPEAQSYANHLTKILTRGDNLAIKSNRGGILKGSKAFAYFFDVVIPRSVTGNPNADLTDAQKQQANALKRKTIERLQKAGMTNDTIKKFLSTGLNKGAYGISSLETADDLFKSQAAAASTPQKAQQNTTTNQSNQKANTSSTSTNQKASGASQQTSNTKGAPKGPAGGGPKASSVLPKGSRVGQYYAFTPEGGSISRPYSDKTYKALFGTKNSASLVSTTQSKIHYAQQNVRVYQVVQESSRNIRLVQVNPNTGKPVPGADIINRSKSAFGNPVSLKAKTANWFNQKFNPLAPEYSSLNTDGKGSIDKLIQQRNKAIANGKTNTVKTLDSTLKARGIDIASLDSGPAPGGTTSGGDKGSSGGDKGSSGGDKGSSGGKKTSGQPKGKSGLIKPNNPAVDPTTSVTKANKASIVKNVKANLPALKPPAAPASGSGFEVTFGEQLGKDVTSGKVKVDPSMKALVLKDQGFQNLVDETMSSIEAANKNGYKIDMTRPQLESKMGDAVVVETQSSLTDSQGQGAKPKPSVNIFQKTPGWKVPIGKFTGGFFVGLGLTALVKWWCGVPASELITLKDVGINLATTYVFMKFPVLGQLALAFMGGYFIGGLMHNYMKGEVNDVMDSLTKSAKSRVGELIGPSNYDRDKFKTVLAFFGPVGWAANFFVKGSTKDSDFWKLAEEKGYPDGILRPQDVDPGRREQVISILALWSQTRKNANKVGGLLKDKWIDEVNDPKTTCGKLNHLFRMGVLNQKAWYKEMKRRQKELLPDDSETVINTIDPGGESGGGTGDGKGEGEGAVKVEPTPDQEEKIKKTMTRSWKQYIDRSKNKELANKVATGWYQLKNMEIVPDTSFKSWVKFYNSIRNDAGSLKDIGTGKKPGSHLSMKEILKAYEVVAGGNKAMTAILAENNKYYLKKLIALI